MKFKTTLSIIMLVSLLGFAVKAIACTAFYTHETASGMNKICYYDHLGSQVAMTVRNVDICPLTFKVKH